MNLMSVLYFFSNLRSIKIFLSHPRSPQVYKNTDPFQNKREENKDGEKETPRQKILPQDSKSYYLEVLIPVCVYSKVWMDIMWESALPYPMCIIRRDQTLDHNNPFSIIQTRKQPRRSMQRKKICCFIFLLGSWHG